MSIKSETLSEVIRADKVPGPSQGQWAYADYALLPEDGNRYEVIDGVLYMSPSPNKKHQKTNLRFLIHLGTHVELAGLGEVFGPPYDVELAPKIIVQPDVIVVLNANLDISTPSHVIGAPDLVVEIASPATANYDRTDKQNSYASAGVREYWIADPTTATVEVLVLEQDQYRSLGVFKGQDTLPSQVVPELPVRVEQFFV